MDGSNHFHSFLQSFTLPLLGLLFLIFYLLGTFFPDYWWTTHWLAFLPAGWKYGFLAVAAALIMVPFTKPTGFSLPENLQTFLHRFGKWSILGITLLTGILIYNFPIIQDYYGDSYKVLPHLKESISVIPQGANDAFFRFGLSPWEGYQTILSIVTYIAFYTGITYGKAFLWMDLICGCLFVWVWLSFLRYYLSDITWRVIMGLAGITAPFMLIYFGHIESYAPIFLFFMMWMLGMLVYLKTNKTGLLWGIVLFWLVCIKLHPVALLFGPALGLLFIRHFVGDRPWATYLLSWKGIATWILVPVTLAGVILYFFVLKDHNDPRHLNETAMAFDRLFLPLFSPEPPLDTYNILSFNHIFDYFSEMLIWSPIGVFLAMGFVLVWRKKISWSVLPIRLVGLTLLLFGSLFFAINPLLSMQLDWDLLTFPGLVFLVFVVVLVKQLEGKEISKVAARKVFPISLGIALLCIPAFIIHTQTDSLSQRYESLGIRMYKTYYEWSSKVIQFGLDMPTYPSRKTYEERKNRVLKKLKPFAQKNIDFEYARLLSTEGKYYLRTEKNYEKAFTWLTRAETYFPKEKNILLYLMEANFVTKKFPEAFAYSMELVKIQYPSEQKAIAIAVQCALEAGIYEEALPLSAYSLKNWPDNKVMQEVNRRLTNEEDVEQLKFLFARE